MIKSPAFQKLAPIQHDPNKKDKVYGWATWVPHRTPQFKAHVARGHAVSAIAQHQYGIIYKLENGRWEEVLNVPSRNVNVPLDCDGCGKSTWVHYKKTNSWGRKGYNSGKIAFDMKDDPAQVYWICNSCR